MVNSYILYKKSLKIQNYKPTTHFKYRMKVIHKLLALSLYSKDDSNSLITYNKSK